MAHGHGAYNKNYRRTVEKRERQKQLKQLRKRLLLRVALPLVCVLVLAAAAVSISQALGGPLPTWNKIYATLGLRPAHLVPHADKDAAASVTFLDVGQGDAVLLQQDGRFCLIDAGTMESTDSLLEQLDDAGVKTLDLLVMTHPHGDHIGGMAAVLGHCAVKQVLLPDFTLCTGETGYMLQHVLDVIAANDIPTITAQTGQVWPLGSGALTVLATGVPCENWNDACIVTRFASAQLSYLSCGDAEAEEIAALLASGQPLQSDIYKATHHGSGTSNTEVLLRAVKPEIVGVSCGTNNDFGHPHEASLRAFAAVHAQVYRTDENGAFTVWRAADERLCVAALCTDAAQTADSSAQDADAAA